MQELQKLLKLKSNMGSVKIFHALYNDDDILLSAVKKIKAGLIFFLQGIWMEKYQVDNKLSSKIYCSFENLSVEWMIVKVKWSTAKFSNEQQNFGLKNMDLDFDLMGESFSFDYDGSF